MTSRSTISVPTAGGSSAARSAEAVGSITLQVAIEPLAAEANASSRKCIECNKPLQAMRIERIPVDVCSDHGVWFDGDELQQVLHRAAE